VPTPPPISPRKRLVFCVIILFATWVSIECISLLAFALVNHTSFSPRAILKESQSQAPLRSGTSIPEIPSSSWLSVSDVLHPYIGYVADPGNNGQFWATSPLGFIFNGTSSEIARKAPNRVVIAVFGGSVASGEFLILKQLIAEHQVPFGSKVDLLNFSYGGYKQPQQLMALSYLLALGANFDIVINLDGFNDVVLPYSDNIPSRLSPFYPHDWNKRTAVLTAESDLRQIGRIEFLKEKREYWARSFRRYRGYLSPTLSLAWQYRDHALARELVSIERQMVANDVSPRTFKSNGPEYKFEGKEKFFGDLADFWMRSSRQMRALCEANGIRYYHFLQPNQYVPNSKPMSQEERRTTASTVGPYRDAVVMGYPFLVRAGERLKSDGEKYFDLTQIFSQTPEPAYYDDCCHLNEAGYKMIGRRIFLELSNDDRRADKQILDSK
jgi:hypothetical protein